MSSKSENRRTQFRKEAIAHAESLLRTAVYMTTDETTASNIVQETYLRAYCLWGNLTGTMGYKTRLFRALVGLLYENSHPHPMPADESSIIPTEPVPVGDDGLAWNIDDDMIEDMCRKVDDQTIRRAIARTPFNHRLIIVLSIVEGFTYQEISEIVEIDYWTVKSRLMGARQYLQTILMKHAMTDGIVEENAA